MRALAALLFAVLLAAPAAAREYELTLERQKLEVEPGRRDTVMSINGSVPGPVLRFREGEAATIRVVNRLKETAAIHWHGLLIPGEHDGAPGFNGFMGIKPGETYTYRFTMRQAGTYWYHAHSATQEQAGQYGALIIDPAGAPIIQADREHVVLLSEHTREDPERILRNLKGDSGYYNFSKRTFPQFLADARKFGLKKTIADRRAWGDMRMDPTDIADVGNYTLLVNGQPTARRPDLRFAPGERVRLRFINGSAMSFMDVRIPGLTMTVVAADGLPVQPVEVDEFRIGVAETYDVLVTPKEDRAYPLWVESIDRRASVLAALAPRAGMAVAAPPARPKQVLLMSEMGHAMADTGGGSAKGGLTPAGGMDAMSPGQMDMAMASTRQPAAMAAMAGMTMAQAAIDPKCPPEHAKMGHCTPTAAAAPTPAADPKCPPEHAAMGHCTPSAPATLASAADPACPPEHARMGHCTPCARQPSLAPGVAQGGPADPACPPEHAAMGHCKPAAAAATANGPRQGSAVALAARPDGGTRFPKVDYGYGDDPMAGMDHAAMGHGSAAGSGGMVGMDHGGMAMPALAREGDTDGVGRVFGWATGAPYGARVLSVRDLVAAVPAADTRPPTREIVIKVSGNMERYIWTMNGAKFGEAPPIRISWNERVRITFVNETMMAHPMHLHGMFFAVENGQPPERMPMKNVIPVAPGRTQSVILTGNEPGEWPIHCHLLYHMESGMMQKLIVARPDGTEPSAAHAMHGGR